MQLKELQRIVTGGEDSRNQFKEDVRNENSLAAEIVAFSNSQGGRIFIGVSDEGALVGLSSSDVSRVNQIISNSANQHVRSPVAVSWRVHSGCGILTECQRNRRSTCGLVR